MMVLGFGGLGVRLVMLQIVDAPAYARIASEQREREILFPARRGTIFDRDGEVLAISIDLQTVYADPQLVEDPVGAAEKLAPLLDEKVEELVGKLRGVIPGDRFEYLARQVEPPIADAVEKLDLPGVYMRPEAKRYYPNERVGAHVLGFVDVDGKGLAGIESQYDDVLQGRPGRMVLEQDPSGHALPQAGFSYERPEPGRDLFLTIDKELQYFTQLTLARAKEAYNAESGIAVVMRPRTGEILALANAPDFDPNEPGEFPDDAQRNRALTDIYEPGSIFKAVTVGSALEENVVRPATKFIVPPALPYLDRVFHDSHSHPTEEMSVTEIIQDSSNVGTIKIGLGLGATRLDEYVRRFGFGVPTGLDFPGEEQGMVLPLDEWSGTTVATVPIGQGIAVTPMQMAVAYSTIANGGLAVEPKLIAGIAQPSGKVEGSSAPAIRRVISRRSARQVTRMLVNVVNEGTGTAAQVPGYVVAGKTGTAQKASASGGYGNEYMASFVGFAPARDPEVVILVTFDDPDQIYGGATAAPTFKIIAEFALRRLGIPPGAAAPTLQQEIADTEDESIEAHD